MIYDVSRETLERLKLFQELIRKWNPRINLVAPGTIDDLWTRHIEDSLQIVPHVTEDHGLWVDIGSGGGFPGIVLAVALADRTLEFRLIESDQRKATFLRTAIRELGLGKAAVLTQRIEQAQPQNANFVSARALAPLPRLMPYLARHLARDGIAWLMKGQAWQSEIIEAKDEWSFDVKSFESATQSGAAILQIRNVTHA